MIRRPPRSTQSRSSAASDVYKRQQQDVGLPLMIPLNMVMLDVFAQRPPQGALTKENDLRPVSYTHLRAHETRHDLVCRLLLEKKKNKKKKKNINKNTNKRNTRKETKKNKK